ncbi:hypothetical protein N7481_005354 [Penicillium waksmanii]|uniref:uncharacterized protein n=1 Tax=Penicillium waksmanii TaxID=69791 RepID=UPI0025487938|nr:uncharacterized protein N7481_005354 [Penicillium waksmanii]KAJ5983255.1 hypothetical protein N7481_005354 [Penicillium waksmanii]
MPHFEKSTPPPLWSSFPSSQRDNSLQSPLSTTPDMPSMGNNNTSTRTRLRESKLFTMMRKPSKKVTAWDPPAYDSQDWKAPTVTNSSSCDFDSRYAFLKDFDTIFLVDDSSSMSGPRWREAEEAIAAIAPICTQFDHDGIDVYFLNHRRAATANTTGAYTNITTAADVQEIFNSVRPRGSTPVGKRLLEILTPYLHRVEMMQASRNADGSLRDPSMLVKPINIIAITDGEFTDDAESVIVQVAKALDHPRCNALPWQVGIQFFQIGDDQRVQRYLQELDDDLGKYCSEARLRDIVDTVPWRGKRGQSLDAEGILKCVLGAVHKKLDRRQI